MHLLYLLSSGWISRLFRLSLPRLWGGAPWRTALRELGTMGLEPTDRRGNNVLLGTRTLPDSLLDPPRSSWTVSKPAPEAPNLPFLTVSNIFLTFCFNCLIRFTTFYYALLLFVVIFIVTITKTHKNESPWRAVSYGSPGFPGPPGSVLRRFREGSEKVREGQRRFREGQRKLEKEGQRRCEKEG